MNIKKYILKRIAIGIPLVFFVLTLNWVIIKIAPGDQVAYLISGAEFVDNNTYQLLLKQYGLDKPLYVQYWIYITKVVQGDFGYSYYWQEPIFSVISESLWSSLLLTGTAFICELSLGITLGIVSAKNPYSIKDNTISSISLITWSMPYFWLGILAIMLFSLQLELFPVQGMIVPFHDGRIVTGLPKLFSIVYHLFLPAMVLGAGRFALYSRFTRASLLEVMRKDYILTARSKGLKENEVVYGHALKNALLPVVTVVAYRLPILFTGAVLVETVFAWPGLGRLLFDSITRRDIQVVLGIFFVFSALTITANLLADVAYAYLDPRIRYE